MNILVDIDDTLLLYPDSHLKPWERGGKERYENAVPNHEEIRRINKLYEAHRIIIFTGRNWDKYDMTISQLIKFKIKFNQLIMGKPQGLYIDADNFKTAKEVEDVFKPSTKVSFNMKLDGKNITNNMNLKEITDHVVKEIGKREMRK